MDADGLAAILSPLEEILSKHLETTGRLVAHCEYLTKRVEELEADQRVAGTRLELVNMQTGIRDSALGERIDQLDERLTTVHKAALRALNLTPGGAPAA